MFVLRVAIINIVFGHIINAIDARLRNHCFFLFGDITDSSEDIQSNFQSDTRFSLADKIDNIFFTCRNVIHQPLEEVF